MGDPLHDPLHDSSRDWDESGMRIRVADAQAEHVGHVGHVGQVGRVERSDVRATRKPMRPAPANEAQTVPPPPLASNESVPVLAVDFGELRQFSLDPSSGFLISLMDGSTTVETLLDVCGMPPEEALRRLDHLVRQGVVRLT